MKTLHVFFDRGGFFSSKAIEFIEEIEPKQHVYYFETPIKDSYSNEINWVKTEKEVYELIASKTIRKVVFHSLHTFQFSFLQKLREISSNQIKVAWVFWSFEYYQLPFNLSKLYSKECFQFKIRKFISILVENSLLFVRRKIKSPFFIGSKRYFSQIETIDEFYSFVEEDFLEIFKKNKKTNYHFLSYLNFDDIAPTISSQNYTEKTIMVGHSGSPLLNHYEVLNKLKEKVIGLKIILPISYGNKGYIKKIKKEITADFNFDSTFLEKRLPKDEYYSLLSSVSVFFLNCYCQQGLGNIVFFLLNGTTLYLSEKSTTYLFLKRKGFFVYSIESLDEMDVINELNENEKNENKLKIKELIDNENVKKGWKRLLN